MSGGRKNGNICAEELRGSIVVTGEKDVGMGERKGGKEEGNREEGVKGREEKRETPSQHLK